jgi:Ni/Fe-hydrogenase subunit HybB-like protein
MTTTSIISRDRMTGLWRLFWVSPGDGTHQARGKHLLQFLLPLIALGGVAALVALVRGHHVMGTTSEISWGVLIATYVFLAVSSSGLCLVGSLGDIFGIELFKPIAKKAVFLAFVVLLLGFGVIGTELERPFLLMKMVVLSPNFSSPIWWMGTLYGVYFLFLTVELVLMLAGDHGRAKKAGIVKLVAAIAASSNLGSVFGLLHSRPYWSGPFLPLYIIATSLVCGAALLILVVYFEDYFTNDRKLRPEHLPLLQALGKLLALFVGILALFTVWRLIAGVNGQHYHLYEVTLGMLQGPLFVSFWLFEVLLALAVPLVVLLGPRRREPTFIALAAVLPVIGMFFVRYNFVYAGQMFSLKPVVGRMGELIDYGPPFKGNVAGMLPYTPSLVEVLIVLGALSAAIVLFVVGRRVLKLEEEA